MRILRLRVRDYRGIRDREVAFAPSGVTIVEGPNEMGKSSLVEAIDVVFDELDNTTKQRVRSIRPADRDAGSSVEIEVETGQYAFTYFKRFHRDRETRLRVTKPLAESWTGREAHERAAEILDETLDTDLWRALRVQQGEGLAQPALGDQPALARALDRAAGGAAGGVEETLFEAARSESARYYTPTGRERRELSAAARAVETAAAEEQDGREALSRMRADVAESESLELRVARLERRCAELGREAAERAEALRAVDALRVRLTNLEARRDAAVAKEESARRDVEERSRLAQALLDASADRRRHDEARTALAPALAEARSARELAERAEANSREAAAGAASAERALRERCGALRDAIDLANLEARVARAEIAEAALRDAERTLSEIRVDDRSLRAIRGAELLVLQARARLEAEGPVVRIAAEAPVAAAFDGRLRPLAPGERREERVTELFQLSIPGVVELSVAAGASASTERKAVGQAETELRTLCELAGVADADAAGNANERRREALQAAEQAKRTFGDCLEGDSVAGLRAQIAELRARGERETQEPRAPGPAARPGAEPAEPGEDARARLTAAERSLADAETQAEAARAAADRALDTRDRERRSLAQLESDARGREHAGSAAKTTALRAAVALETARGEATDELLVERHTALAGRSRELQGEVAAARRELAESKPDAARAAAERAEAQRHRASADLAKARDTSAGLRGRLEARAGDGLFERAAGAAARRHQLETTLARLSRRAAAARLLYETLAEERERSRLAYEGPLREQIEHLGRQVFGASFGVELSPSLEIARRTLDGVTLAFEQLSAGAREQLALLSRLAGARLVADEGSVPLLLDDALGHSDARRLERMAGLLARAGRDGQVIVLTCSPDRYRGVAGARFLSLR